MYYYNLSKNVIPAVGGRASSAPTAARWCPTRRTSSYTSSSTTTRSSSTYLADTGTWYNTGLCNIKSFSLMQQRQITIFILYIFLLPVKNWGRIYKTAKQKNFKIRILSGYFIYVCVICKRPSD